jgi:hypothetical protein
VKEWFGWSVSDTQTVGFQTLQSEMINSLNHGKSNWIEYGLMLWIFFSIEKPVEISS